MHTCDKQGKVMKRTLSTVRRGGWPQLCLSRIESRLRSWPGEAHSELGICIEYLDLARRHTTSVRIRLS